MTWHGVLLFLPGWDASPSWVYLPPSSLPWHRIHPYLFILRGEEGHCKSNVSCPRTQKSNILPSGLGDALTTALLCWIINALSNLSGSCEVYLPRILLRVPISSCWESSTNSSNSWSWQKAWPLLCESWHGIVHSLWFSVEEYRGTIRLIQFHHLMQEDHPSAGVAGFLNYAFPLARDEIHLNCMRGNRSVSVCIR